MILPRIFGPPAQAADIKVSPELLAISASQPDEALQKLQTSGQGLSSAEAARRLKEHGPNVVAQDKGHSRLKLLGRALVNPLVILLSILAAISALTGDFRAASVMMAMVVLGVVLRFVQEARADTAAAKLKAMISVTATVVRDGDSQGDAAGAAGPRRRGAAGRRRHDPRRCAHPLLQRPVPHPGQPHRRVVPGREVRTSRRPGQRRSPLELKNVCFLGTSVESGTATAVVVATGLDTYLGSMAGVIVGQEVPTSFDKGVSRFTWLMIRFMLVMVPLVFLINGLTKHNWREAFFFALAVAVGLTPEMLPMIVTVCLSKGPWPCPARR